MLLGKGRGRRPRNSGRGWTVVDGPFTETKELIGAGGMPSGGTGAAGREEDGTTEGAQYPAGAQDDRRFR